MAGLKAVAALLCALVILQVVDCKHQKGEVKSSKSSEKWIPVSRFWFGASSADKVVPTWFQWSATTHTNSNSTLLLIYDDQPSSWPTAYKNRNSWSCDQLQSASKDFRNVFPNNNNGGTFTFNESFARHWYVVVSDCYTDVNVEYDFVFNNVGNSHNHQFSMDEQGFWAISLTFFLFFMILVSAQMFVSFMLHRASSFHRVVKVLTLSIILQFVAYMFMLIHYDMYAKNGVGSPGSHFFGVMLNYTAHWLFVVMLLLIARGVNEHFVLAQRRNALIVVAALFILDLIFWIWRSVTSNTILQNPFIYGSAPGILMLIIRAILGVYFILLLRFSYIEEGNPERRQFLFRFGIIGAVWFFFEPFIVAMVAAILSSSVEAYAMDRSVAGFWYTVNFLILCAFTFFFYWPSRISNFYDFSKADVMIGAASTTSPYETL